MHLQRSDVKKIIFTVTAILLITANVVYYVRDFSNVIPLYTYGFRNQTMYNTEFLKNGTNQDAFIRMLVRDKKVIYAREIKPYSTYPSYGHEYDQKDFFFSSEYFLENNYARYFDEYASSTAADISLPALKPVSKLMEGHQKDFTFMGYGNDLLRYSFLTNKETNDVSSYFIYSWIYYTLGAHYDIVQSYDVDYFFRIYVCTDGLEKADTLVAVWDNAENLYLMPEKYYMNSIAGEVNADK